MTADIQYQKIRALGIGEWIDGVVTSEEAGIEKPGKEFFLLCLEKAMCNSSECAFVGDSLKGDVLGACAVGMQGVLYDKKNQTQICGDERNKEYKIIHHFRELFKALGINEIKDEILKGV